MKNLLPSVTGPALVVIAAGSLLGFAILRGSGSPGGYTGAPIDGRTCTNCHSSASGTGSLTITAPASYTPGVPLDITVEMDEPGESEHGFELVVVDATTGNNVVGTITLNQSLDATKFSLSNTHVTHDSQGGDPGQWKVTWTPGVSETQAVTVYVAGASKTSKPVYNETWTISLALPVELSSFDVRLDGQNAILDWRTESESNNIGFDIQHADDSGSFEAVGFVPGAGTTSEARDYSYTINDLLPGTHRFRLRQIDFDGTTTVSEQIEVAVGVPDQFFLSEAYPNPFNPTTTFEFAVRQDQEVRVRVFDEMGRQVTDLFNGTLSANEAHRVTFDAAGLASGTYIIQLQGADFYESRQVVLLK
ncbi:MAG: T9SS type A sorting domain-containing protein [Rhodothermales bacterium]|nr:T9SS type A sorting domain-containing protein [Rhodothermales bacterium]